MRIGSLIIALSVLTFTFAGMMYWGCATANHMSSEERLAAAKIIARDAGYYVADNNPDVAQTVITWWKDIKPLTGQGFNDAFIDALDWYLDQHGVAGSERLIADARDLLDIFGFSLDIPIDHEFMDGVSIISVKVIVQAFVDGMGYAGK